MLLQEDAEGIDHPASYFSRKFNKHQVHYSTIEQETLALLWALQHFQVYLGSSYLPITVFTDNKPLTFLSRMYNRNQRLMQQALIVQDYNITIQHKKGSENVINSVGMICKGGGQQTSQLCVFVCSLFLSSFRTCLLWCPVFFCLLRATFAFLLGVAPPLPPADWCGTSCSRPASHLRHLGWCDIDTTSTNQLPTARPPISHSTDGCGLLLLAQFCCSALTNLLLRSDKFVAVIVDISLFS